MKHLLKIADILGKELRTRSLLERFATTLNADDDYMLDMSGVEMISRSAADELYTITNTYHVDIIRMTSFVQQMYDAVKLGRFQPRQHLSNDVTFIKCTDIHSLTTCLQK